MSDLKKGSGYLRGVNEGNRMKDRGLCVSDWVRGPGSKLPGHSDGLSPSKRPS